MFLTALITLLSMASIACGYPVAERQVGYQMLYGDGTSWPSTIQWATFETMWSNNQPLLATSCTQYGQANNSPQEINDIHTAIQAEATAAGLDARFILAIILQESGGCVRAPTSAYPIVNPGLMQSHAGTGTCFNVNPCPSSMISQMLQDGAAGTASGDGLKQNIATATSQGASDATAVYRAARIYNSGSYVLGSGLENPTCATRCYSTDAANRLLGWAGLSTPCTLDVTKKI